MSGPAQRLVGILRSPTWPGTLERPAPRSRLGVDYPTNWARRAPARFARCLLGDNVTRPLVHLLCAPKIEGLERLEHLDGPVIFAGNHASHLDTAIVLSCLPARFRHKAVVAAAADYFFDRHLKAATWAFALGSIPIERNRVTRKSADLAAELLGEGWSLIIFPEGGRSADGWAQEFRGGAAYLARRCGVPIVPFHLRGTRPMLAKGSSMIRPGKVELRFGDALRGARSTQRGERESDPRRFTARIEAAVAALSDEAETDWWSARRRAASGTTPSLRGPDIAPWRRSWVLPDSARNDGPRRRLGPSKPW